MSVPAESYGVFTRRLITQANDTGQPISGTFELTDRCNLACRMCYICVPAGKKRAGQRELTADEWVRLAATAVEHGMLFITLTGGEVFVRSDFFSIYRPLTRLGLNIALFTNGTLITPEIAGRLAACPPNRLEITLYGATQAVYESVTGVLGSYARCLAGIEALLAAGHVTLLLKTTLSNLNRHELPAMQKMAEEWGVPFQVTWLLTQRRDRRACGIERYRLSPPEGVALEAEARQVGYRLPADDRQAGAESTGAFHCSAGRSSFTITPHGEMHACLDLPFPSAHPLEIGFVEAWNRTRAFVASTPVSSTCGACTLQAYCPRCPASSYLETETLTAPAPYYCAIARERHQSLSR